MTQLNKDMNLRCIRVGIKRTLSLFVTLLTLYATAFAVADVELNNSVQKVESFLDDAGELQRKLVDADSVVPGDELRYTITFTNEGEETIDAGSIVITNPIPESTEYLDGTAFGSGTSIVYSIDGEAFASAEELTLSEGGVASGKDYTTIRWIFQPELAPGETSHVSFNVQLK